MSDQFEREATALDAYIAAGSKGPCPMCGAPEGYLHGRKYCLAIVGAAADGHKPGKESA